MLHPGWPMIFPCILRAPAPLQEAGGTGRTTLVPGRVGCHHRSGVQVSVGAGGFPQPVPGAAYSGGVSRSQNSAQNPHAPRARLSAWPSRASPGWIHETGSDTAEDTGLCSPRRVCSSSPAVPAGAAVWGCAGLSGSLPAPLEALLMTAALPVSLVTAHASIPRQKLSWHIMGTEGSTGQQHSALGGCFLSPHPRAPAPALSEAARTADSQIIPVQ